MNCDQVFDILTRGPFPTGTPCDTGVESHLSSCTECRRLAEALRPALELFQEAVGPEESRDLPGYWCAVATDRKLAMSQVKDAASGPELPNHWANVRAGHGVSALAAWRFVALLALGVMAGSMMALRGTLDGFSSVPPLDDGRAASVPAPKSDESRFILASHQEAGHQELSAPPDDCSRQELANMVLVKADLGGLSCCTDCHHAGGQAIPKSATAMVTQSCQLCH